MAESGRILVVDDSEMNVDLLRRRLGKKGYEVLTATSGPEALSILESTEVDLVLLDVMMPGMSGIEVLETVRKTRSAAELPIIMATARSDAADVVEALDRGANDYVTKPIEIEVLVARTRAHLRTRRSSASSSGSNEVGPGVVLDRKYRLEEVIGVGGFASVYRAVHLTLDRVVAVKLMHRDMLASETALKRFAEEGASACRVRHPNAVAVLDAGSSEQGVPYLVMELLDGPSLADVLRTERVLPLNRVVSIISPICDALEEAHRTGIVHRDIKPSNIVLSRGPNGEEVVKVLDFGIAKLLEAQPDSTPTLSEITGTPRYMSPERLAGEASDGRADVYSVGATLYEMLCGTLPFPRLGGTPMQQAMLQLIGAPTTLDAVRFDLPAGVVALVMSALAKNAAERPSLSQLKEGLLAWSDWVEPKWPPDLRVTPAEEDSGSIDQHAVTRADVLSSGVPSVSGTVVDATESGELGVNRLDDASGGNGDS